MQKCRRKFFIYFLFFLTHDNKNFSYRLIQFKKKFYLHGQLIIWVAQSFFFFQIRVIVYELAYVYHMRRGATALSGFMFLFS